MKTAPPKAEELPREYLPDLIVAQRLLTEGVDGVARSEDVWIRVGLLVTDLAVESILKLVLRHFGKEVDPNSGFPKLVDSVVAAGGEKLPLGWAAFTRCGKLGTA